MPLAPLYYILAFALAAFVLFSATTASHRYEALQRYQTAEEKTDTLVKEVLEGLSLGLYEGGTRKSRVIASLARRAQHHAGRARVAAWLLLALSTGFLLAVYALHRRAGVASPAVPIAHLLGTSAIFLAVGLGAPILTISAHREVAILGEVVLQYETRAILTTVMKLAATDNWFLASLLFLFSVLAPVSKLTLSLVALWARRHRVRHLSLGTVELIGRWSMTDVFVVAILLAFLAAETEQLTDATLGAGLYFFAGYGVLSLLAGHLIVRHNETLRGRAKRTDRIESKHNP